MIRRRAACLVFGDDQVLLMWRLRGDQEYYVVPGGGIEVGETSAEACLRELSEETSLHAIAVTPVESTTDDAGRTDYFLVHDAEGEPRLGGPEAERDGPGNRYELRWIPIGRLHTLSLRPPAAYEVIKKAYDTLTRTRGNDGA